MYRSPILATLASLLTTLIGADPATAESPQLYEIRSYLLGEKSDAAAIDQYLSAALIPALERQGVGPIGAFTNSENDESNSSRIVLVIPYRNAEQIAEVRESLNDDSEYLEAAANYLDRGPEQSPYQRIQSELLSAMKCWPELKVPDGLIDDDDRVYELRVYESANEKLGNLKVDMFNNGEVPIFLDSGIQPIFIGQSLIGPQTPNLTYLTAYPNERARGQAWTKFRNHPDWQVLKEVAKYQGTVSKIDKFVLVAKPYSQM